ncbi:hypothetical protein SAMN05216428_104177 [Nitrosospira sp. Nsp11]|nr:hypothetical protein SAMN05216315_1074 [Nitrosospira sp. Nsp18]SHL64711.1 hypothetical protein SAMN05216428_104177 [Nitrosospira sp. Nsp11]
MSGLGGFLARVRLPFSLAQAFGVVVPARVRAQEWAQEHQDELMEDWELCQRMHSPKKISPLP